MVSKMPIFNYSSLLEECLQIHLAPNSIMMALHTFASCTDYKEHRDRKDLFLKAPEVSWTQTSSQEALKMSAGILLISVLGPVALSGMGPRCTP